MKRVCLVYLCMFLATALIAQSDSGSIVNQQNKTLRPIPDFRRLVPSAWAEKMRVRPIHLRDILPNLLA